MKSYIKRLSQDIEKLGFKRDCIANFLTNRREECDQTQIKLLKEQGELMEQLLVVMNQRLEYERMIHPAYFEDLEESEEVDADDSEEYED